jgi:phenylalanine-4-hydroxylase
VALGKNSDQIEATASVESLAKSLPQHLRRYIVDQDYSRYTPIDQAAWRHIMRQLKSFLSVYAHPSYKDGLKKTGIEVDRIPLISHMSERLQEFGWRAVPVSGFIPPAAFMELQSLGVLPIASDMRSLEHLLYTPAPDIVHEAAGHAPILVDPAFAAYLKSYASVARKAIISREDMDQYEAIRILSDVKEDPASSLSQVTEAEKKLAEINLAMGEISEAARLGRMNWWTAEYGLIGDIRAPRIFGAGLLSSIGESRSCLAPAVRKIPLTIDCINYSYDITEKQPQLFVVEAFEQLESVLQSLANQMAFRIGGVASAKKALVSRTVNTFELENGLQISGILSTLKHREGSVAYLGFSGPTLIAINQRCLPGQGVDQHGQGFGTPIGRVRINNQWQNLADLSKLDCDNLRWSEGREIQLDYETGAQIRGYVKKLTFNNNRLSILTLKGATACYEDEITFRPEWGDFDIACGTKVISVYGGPADREAFGETQDFSRKLVPHRHYSNNTLARHRLYAEVRKMRESGSHDPNSLNSLLNEIKMQFPNDWLVQCELLEVAEDANLDHQLIAMIENSLSEIARNNLEAANHITDARRTLHLEN